MLLAVVLAGACTSGDDEPTPGGETSQPTAEGTGLPPLTAVRGERRPSAPSVANEAVLGLGPLAVMNERAVLDFANAVADWLDSHLDELQRDEGGRLGALAAPGLVDAADRAAIRAATSGLATRKDPVRKAVYELRVAQSGAPRWVTAEVSVTRHSGTVATAVFTFAPTPEGPQLVAFGPGENTTRPGPTPTPTGTS